MHADSIKDSRGMFGTPAQTHPTSHLIGAAIAWGGSFEADALYLFSSPEKNDGRTTYKLHLGDVPVDGFWSISVYNAQGYFQKNPYDSYSINSLTALKNNDGSTDIQFGGCHSENKNCLSIMPGWNYLVRFYLPRKKILNQSWRFPDPELIAPDPKK